MNRIITLLLLCAALVTVSVGCGNKELTANDVRIAESSSVSDSSEADKASESESEEPASDEESYSSESDVEADSSESNEREYVRGGAENYGFIDIPSDWVTFTEEGMEDEGMVQYSDVNGESVITLQYYDDVDAETAATNVYVTLEESAENLTAAMVELDGYEAYQVYGYMPDTNEILVCWFFDGDDGLMHYLAIEGTDMELFDLSETYSVNE